MLVAVYLIYIYFKNICNFIWIYKNKSYICTQITTNKNRNYDSFKIFLHNSRQT